MTLLALVAALLIERARALSSANPAHSQYLRLVRFLERSLDAGSYQQGVLAWVAAIVPLVAGVAFFALWLERVAPPLAALFDIAMVYLTMGFRQFDHAYRATHEALRAGDLSRARSSLESWYGGPSENLTANEVSRLAIERGLFCAHRHVFGVMAWFVVFGAAGAVFYRAIALLHDRWGVQQGAPTSPFGRFGRDAFRLSDWLPLRLTAISFAIVGDFEDSMYCWRTQSAAWPDSGPGIVLASGAGAIGVKLGSAIGSGGPAQMRPDLGTGEDADSELMTSAVGLIWRALLLWLFLILLVTVASWLGSTRG